MAKGEQPVSKNRPTMSSFERGWASGVCIAVLRLVPDHRAESEFLRIMDTTATEFKIASGQSPVDFLGLGGQYNLRENNQ